MKILSAIKKHYEHYDNSNKLVIGKMKDETAGVAIKEFVRLKPKMYAWYTAIRNTLL